jgi:IS1 family transposase
MVCNGSAKKKADQLSPINKKVLNQLDRYNHRIDFVLAEEAEIDEQGSYVRKKSNQRWLWHAIDHVTGNVLAYVFGKRKDSVFKKLQLLIEPFGLKRFYTDDWGAYTRHLDKDKHEIGKAKRLLQRHARSRHTNR